MHSIPDLTAVIPARPDKCLPFPFPKSDFVSKCKNIGKKYKNVGFWVVINLFFRR